MNIYEKKILLIILLFLIISLSAQEISKLKAYEKRLQNLEQEYVQLLKKMSQIYAKQGRYNKAVSLLEKTLHLVTIAEKKKIVDTIKIYSKNLSKQTRARLVSFHLLHPYSRTPLNLEVIKLNGKKIKQGKEYSLKPGEYHLKVSPHPKSMALINEKIYIPAGTWSYKVTRFLLYPPPVPIIHITGDYPLNEDLIPDVFTLNGKSVQKGLMLKPGIYKMVLKKSGYYPIVKRISFTPSPKPFYIKEKMISKPRRLGIKVKSHHNGKEIKPDFIMIAGQKIHNRHLVKPGSYQITIQKKGYETFSNFLRIGPGENDYFFQCTLACLPVKITYKIIADFSGKKIIPDLIIINDKQITETTRVMPGKYILQVEKIGFHKLIKDIVIKPGDATFLFKKYLKLCHVK